jgi:monoamine oxidase
MHPRRVAIVGGGPGGLFTAWLLERQASRRIDVQLYEASGRLGGKILTPSFHTAAVRYEAGAAEFYDYSVVDQDPLREAVALLGLPTRPLAGSAVLLDGAVLGTVDDVRSHLGPASHRALLDFDDRAKAFQSPRRFYESGVDPDGHADGRFDAVLAAVAPPAARRYLETMLHSDLATEPHVTSGDYGLQNYLMNDPAYMGLYCIPGGNEQLVQALVARIGATVRTREPVTAIGRDGTGRLRVRSCRDGHGCDEPFDAVVVALPTAYLAGIRFEGPRLGAALADHLAHHDHPAHYLRITILFERPFWRRYVADAFFMLDAFGGCCLYDESAREPDAGHGVLGWLLAGTAALEACGQSDDELVTAALASLPPSCGDARAAFREGRVHRWAGAVSGLPGGVRRLPLDRRHQPEPVEHPQLFLVGDYLFDSTLNGVFDSATHVAGWLAALAAAASGDAA